jgi:outer membrane receptor for ferrienterochelin and colicins
MSSQEQFMFRPQNNIPAMFATLALVAACPTLTRAADDPASPDAAPADEATATHGPGSKAPGTSDTSNLPAVVVTAQRLNEARAGIQTQTGASTYTIDSAAIAATPGGDNTLLNQVILQAPGVVQDSFGQLHVRGDHNGLQYRLNGVILPEGINVFSQSFDAKLIQSMSLITGALPAEYGLRTAGIIDITTKSGIFDEHGNVSVYGGSHGNIEPSFFHGGSIGGLNYFVSGDFLRNDLGVESPDGRSDPLHDHTTQYHGFAYLEYLLGENDRLSAVLGTSHGKFQIPNVSGLQPSLGLTVNGQTDFPSELLNENQTEITHYGIVSWQHSVGHFNTQTSLSARYSSLTYTPDWLGELLYNGIAQAAFKRDVAYGLQNDSSYQLTDDHTIRGGVYFRHDRATSKTHSQVLLTDADGTPLNDIPYTVIDNGEQSQMIESVYLQDEWRLLSTLTVNYGLRFDRYSAYSSGSRPAHA